MIVTLLVQACAIFFWAASLQAQVQSNAEDIIELKQDVNDIDSDIRAILVGIEQVKARLGIVEDAN